jgi:hypothetical protein
MSTLHDSAKTMAWKQYIMCIYVLEGLRIQEASIVIKRNIMIQDNNYKW